MIVQSAWIVALLLVLSGQRLPGGSLPWTGGGIALFVAVAAAVRDPSWPYLGALLLLFAAAEQTRLGYRAQSRKPVRLAPDADTRPSGQHVGNVATVTRAIRGGFGMVMIGDESWQVCSDEDIPEGRKVQVVGNEGSYLTVRSAD